MSEISPKIRLGHSLNEEEKKHITDRKSAVQECLKRNNITCSLDEVPNIAVLGSGGGERAMVGLLGSLDQMGKEDLLDCILYLSGVSGSTWCMSSLYHKPNWSKNLEQVTQDIVKRTGLGSVDFSTRKNKLQQYYKQNDNYSMTDVWAALLVPQVVAALDQKKLSDQRDGHSKDPYPIYTVIDKDSKDENLKKDPWFELTPHEAGYSLTGAFVDIQHFGSQFDSGVLKKEQPEKDMLYIQGLCGSALADRQEIWNTLIGSLSGKKKRSTEMKESNIFAILQKVVNLNICILKGEDCTLLETELNSLQKGKKNSRGEDMILKTADWRTSGEMEKKVKTYSEDVCESNSDSVEDKESAQWYASEALKLSFSWTWGTIYNFLRNVAAEDVAESVQKEDIRHFEDAGLLLNSPYFSVLRPEREVDLIISLDFSDGDPMLTVKEAFKKCQDMGMSFPTVVVDPEDTNTKDFYVFKGNGKVPTVIHMPLFNINNCGDQSVDSWREKYTTFQRSYSPEMIDELMKMAAMNIRNNKANLLQEIEEVIKQKRAIKSQPVGEPALPE